MKAKIIFTMFLVQGLFVHNYAQTALDLKNSTSDFVAINNNFVFNQLDAISFSLWVNRPTYNNDWEYMAFDFSDGGNSCCSWNNRYTIEVRDKVIFNAEGNSGISARLESPLISNYQNIWNHILITIDALDDKLIIFINGNAVKEGNFSNNTGSLSLGLGTIFSKLLGTRTGNYGVDGHYGYLGLLDEVSIWSKALKPHEVKALYESNCLSGNEPGLLGYWNFNEGSGTTVIDVTGNGNNGTLVNGAIYSNDYPAIDCSIDILRNIEVPRDYSTIQEALDNGLDGDTVVISDGVYQENNLTFNGKEIVLKSRNGPGNCIIDGGTNGNRIFSIVNKETFNTEISGFTIQNATNSVGSAIYVIDNSYVTVKNCVIKNCSSSGTWTRPAIALGHAYNNGPHSPAGIKMYDCILEGNSSYYGGAVFNAESGSTISVFERCIFRNNTGYYGSAIFGAKNSLIKNCLFYSNNSTNSNGGVISNEGGHPTILNCTFANNNAHVIRRNDAMDTTFIINSIVYNNKGLSAELSNSNTLQVSYTLSDIIISGQGNLNNNNPNFVNPSAGNYGLSSNSPCIDSGNPSPEYVDLDGTINDIGYQYFDQCETIESIVTVSGLMNSNTVRRAGVTLNSTESITGSKILYTAGNSIVLKPGFSVSAGSEFTAKITPCISPASRIEENQEYWTIPITNDMHQEPNLKVKNLDINVYPNPASNWINVTYEIIDDGKVSLKLYDNNGLHIPGFHLEENHKPGFYQNSIDISSLSSGIYYLSVTKHDNNKAVRKIIKY